MYFCLLACGIGFFSTTHLDAAPQLQAKASFHRGVALGMYDQNQDADYCQEVSAIRTTHATHVSLVLVYFQDTVTSTQIAPRKGFSPSVANIKKTLHCIRDAGMQATLFPIVHITNRAAGDWRGTIKPLHIEEWFKSYTRFITEMAEIAASEQAPFLVVGSEYVSTEHQRAAWLSVIKSVRQVYHGQLIYSANWDHFEPVSFFDAVDFAGVTAYHSLTASNFDPTIEEMVQAWQPIKRTLQRFQKRAGKPLIITELGYPTLDGANIYPWDETRNAKIDTEEQRRCYYAFMEAFKQTSFLSGIYFWIWFGQGGLRDSGFSPKGKPAEALIRSFYE